MPESRSNVLLQTSTHILAVGAGVVYVFGFIIVSAFDAKFGFANFSLFRSKVISAGTLFTLLVAVGVLLTFRLFSFFGFSYPVQTVSNWMTPDNRPLALIGTGTWIPFGCFAIVMLLGFTLPNFGQWVGKSLKAFIPVLVLFPIVILGRKWIRSHPAILVVLQCLNSLALLLCLYKYVSPEAFWFVFWLSSVCLITALTVSDLKNPEAIRAIEWERKFFMLFGAVVLVFALKVYPNIRNEFGGGEPIPVVLHLTKNLANFNSQAVAVSLLDETDQGYYILSGSEAAIFVKRDLVEEIEFQRPH